METGPVLIVIAIIFIISIFVIRALGAWMLRINEVINLLNDIRKLLRDEKKSDKSKTFTSK